jgi:hypothetical protein
LSRRYHGKGTYYIRGHLLNHHLGGPGGTWSNLTPIDRSANSTMSADFEEPVKTRVLDKGRTAHFRVTAHYGRTHRLAGEIDVLRSNPNKRDPVVAQIIQAEQKLPKTIECVAEVAPAKGQQETEKIDASIAVEINDQNSDLYHLGPEPIRPFYVDEAAQAKDGESQLRRLRGVDPDTAKKIIANRPKDGYRWVADLKRHMNWEEAAETPLLIVRIYRRK